MSTGGELMDAPVGDVIMIVGVCCGHVCSAWGVFNRSAAAVSGTQCCVSAELCGLDVAWRGLGCDEGWDADLGRRQ